MARLTVWNCQLLKAAGHSYSQPENSSCKVMSLNPLGIIGIKHHHYMPPPPPLQPTINNQPRKKKRDTWLERSIVNLENTYREAHIRRGLIFILCAYYWEYMCSSRFILMLKYVSSVYDDQMLPTTMSSVKIQYKCATWDVERRQLQTINIYQFFVITGY